MASLLDLTKNLFNGGVQNVQRNANPILESIKASALIGSGQAAQAVQSGINRISNIPRFELPQSRAQNPLLRTGINIAKGIPESIINIPRNYAVGITRTGQELGQSHRYKRPINLQNLVGGIAPLSESLIDVGTMGGFTLGKQLAKSSAKQAIKQPLKKVVLSGALKGAGAGGLGGLTYGLDTQYGKKFNVGELATNVAAGSLLGGVIGGSISGLGGIKGLITRPKQVDKELVQKATQWKPGKTIIKPKGMTRAQWDFQLKFNNTYGRNPYEPVTAQNLTEALKIEGEKRAGLSIRKKGSDVIPSRIPGAQAPISDMTTATPVKPSIPQPLEQSQPKLPVNTLETNVETRNPSPSIIDPVSKFEESVVTKKPVVGGTGIIPEEKLRTYETDVIDAEMKSQLRSLYSDNEISLFNRIKRMSMSKDVAAGDVETLYKKNPDLAERAFQAVKEKEPNITTNDQAFEYIQSIPTKAESIAPKLPTEQTTGLNVYNAEPTIKTQQKIVGRNIKLEEKNRALAEKKTYDEWQKQVFGEAQVRTIRKAEADLLKAMKIATNESSFKLDTADAWKDKPTILLGRETMDRNFEDIMGSQAPEMKKRILEPIYQAEAQRNRFLNKERGEIASLGIKPGSKESALVQQFGEGKITEAQVRAQSKVADKVINATRVIRSKYDNYLDQLNKVLTRNGYDPIKKRADYFHHFQELGNIFENIGTALKANDLPTDINGLSADFKPGKTFFNAALKRKGDKTAIDAIGGIDKYLEGASNQIFHTDNIQRLRTFEDALRNKYAGTTHLSNFVANLGEYINVLAGKKSMLDRGAEAMIGRSLYTGVNNLKRQVGANMVGANVSSALTNFIPLTQTLATTKKTAVLQALMSTIKNTFKNDGFIDESNFLTTRMGADRLAKSNWQKVGDKAGWLFKNVDSFVSQIVTRSKYYEALSNGKTEKEALRTADNWARKLLAGRGKGEMPTLFNSQVLGALTQFQLEVNNQLSFMAKDIPRNFDKVGAASALGQLFLYSYLFNNLYEKVAGRRPAFDPIGVAQMTYEDYTNLDMKKGQATKNLVGNVSNQLPFASTFTGGRLPITSALPDVAGLYQGTTTPTKELTKLSQFILPTGGGQIKKTIEGVKVYNQGASTSPSGRVRFDIPQTAGNRIKTAVFGQWSTPEAQKYLREGQSVLGEKQSQKVLTSPNKTQEFSRIKAEQKQSKAEEAIKEQMKSGTDSVVQSGQKYFFKDQQFNSETGSYDAVIRTIDLSKPLPVYKPTGNAELDKKLKSSYNSAITSRISDITKLYELGKITAEEAEKKILSLKKNKISTGKKPKKISIKSPKYKKIKLAKIKPIKIKKIKTPKLKAYKPKKLRIT